jgi:hypothetical protein
MPQAEREGMDFKLGHYAERYPFDFARIAR